MRPLYDEELTQDLGAVMLAFLSDWGWVERRVESVTFPDEVTIHRRVSVDFMIPEGFASPLPPTADQPPVFFTPLALLGKQGLIGFDLRDEAGKALPLLTRDQNGRLVKATLIELAKAINADRNEPMQDEFPEELKKELSLIASSPPDAALVIWDHLEEAKDEKESDNCLAWRKFLTVEDKFMALAQDFAVGFPLLVPVASEVGTRRIVKFSYQTSAPPRKPSSRARQVSRGFGWHPRIERIQVPSIAQGRCFHLEVQAPEGLQITRGTLSSSVKPEPTSWQKPSADVSQPGSERVHMHINAPGTATGRAYVSLRARPSTISRAALTTAFLTTVSLALASWRHDLAQDNLGPSISLLLLVPTALSIYVARPREPVITTGLLLGQRILAVCCGILAVAAAALLLIGQDCQSGLFGTSCEPWQATPWILGVLTALAGIITAIFCVTAFLTTYPPEKAAVSKN